MLTEIDEKEALGKTILSIGDVGDDEEHFAIVFMDGTWLDLQINSGLNDCCECRIYPKKSRLSMKNYCAFDLPSLRERGIITDEECTAMEKKREEERAAAEQGEYERLKAKFGSK